MHEEARTPKRVDPDEYTEEYYLNDCEGFSLFRDSRGRQLSPRLAQAFKLADVRPGQRVLDIACGRGELVVQSALRGAQAFGIDYASAATKLTHSTLAASRGDHSGPAGVARMDATRLGFPPETFDTVLMVDFVEHLYPGELEQAIAESFRVLKPSGRLIIHTAPNRLLARVAWPRYMRHVHRAILALARRLSIQDQLINPLMLPTDVEFPMEGDYEHVHVNEQTPDGLAAVVRARGFRTLKLSLRDPPGPPLYPDLRYTLEIRLLDAIRSFRPISLYWPLNRFFSVHIWVTAQRPG